MESEHGHARQDDGAEVDLLVRQRPLPQPAARSTDRILQAARTQAERRRAQTLHAPQPQEVVRPTAGWRSLATGWLRQRGTPWQRRWAVAAPALGALVLAVALWRTPQTSEPIREDGGTATTAVADVASPIIILPLGDPFLDELDWRLNRVARAVGALGAAATASQSPHGGAALDGRLQTLRQSARALSQDLEAWDGPAVPLPGAAPLDNDTPDNTSWQWPMTDTPSVQEV